ncbi:hypothetical protein, partial [Enterococcus faecalis]|uniref:hypothetical protein n=1 Tax=Enterococcus faecalis TaxID=1351 RepID=UPI0040556C14
MMTMCPRCLELYSEIWSKPCCKCADKTIPVDIELINVVQMLLTRGFDVSYATCYPDKEQGEIEAMEIEWFGNTFLDKFYKVFFSLSIRSLRLPLTTSLHAYEFRRSRQIQ